jgi:hypothetical protein
METFFVGVGHGLVVEGEASASSVFASAEDVVAVSVGVALVEGIVRASAVEEACVPGINAMLLVLELVARADNVSGSWLVPPPAVLKPLLRSRFVVLEARRNHETLFIFFRRGRCRWIDTHGHLKVHFEVIGLELRRALLPELDCQLARSCMPSLQTRHFMRTQSELQC